MNSVLALQSLMSTESENAAYYISALSVVCNATLLF